MAQNKVESKEALSTNNLIAIAILISLLALLLGGFISKQLVSQLSLNNRVISKKSAAEAQLKQNLEAVTILQSNYASLGSSQVGLILDSLPVKPDFPSIVSMSEVLAGISGLKLKSVSPEQTTSSQTDVNAPAALATAVTPKSYTYTVAVEGNYDSLYKFFGGIELSSRPLKISGITVEGPTNAQQAKLTLQTFYMDPPDLKPKTELVK